MRNTLCALVPKVWMLYKMRLNVRKELAASRTEPYLPGLERDSRGPFLLILSLMNFAFQRDNVSLSAAGRRCTEVKTYLR